MSNYKKIFVETEEINCVKNQLVFIETNKYSIRRIELFTTQSNRLTTEFATTTMTTTTTTK